MTTDPKGIIQHGPEADEIRAIERERLRALVAADMDVARRLHADDFQLITPAGQSLSQEEYLDGVASGDIDYRVWEPETMAVHVSGQLAHIRYQARIDIIVEGQPLTSVRTWHTDTYEKRDGRWQVVWSHATAIR